MKQLKMIINCLNASLKKKFFKYTYYDLTNDFSDVIIFDTNDDQFNCKENDEEYLEDYMNITRWQTV